MPDTARAAKFDDVNISPLPEIALATALTRQGQRLIEIAGSISAYQSMGAPPSAYDIREAETAVSMASAALGQYRVALTRKL